MGNKVISRKKRKKTMKVIEIKKFSDLMKIGESSQPNEFTWLIENYGSTDAVFVLMHSRYGNFHAYHCRIPEFMLDPLMFSPD